MSKYYFISAKGRRTTENEAQQKFKDSLINLNKSVIASDKAETIKKVLIRKQNRLNKGSDSEQINISFEKNKDGDIILKGFPFADFKLFYARLL